MMKDLIELDSLNRQTALELQSFIVEAPAGAGKTELLTQRYLRLLAVVDEPEEIVALTFSNKATTEMRNRILHSLENAQLQTIETAPHKLITRQLATAALNRSHARAWHLITQPARLRMMTIDALCSSLARQMPLLSRAGGQPTVSNNVEAHYIEASRLAMAGILQETTADGIVTTALRYMDNNANKLQDLIAHMLAKRDQWLPLVGAHSQLNPEDIALHIEDALQHLIEQALQEVLKAVPASVQQLLMPVARYAASQLPADHEFYALLDWDWELTHHIEDLVIWRAMSELLMPKASKGEFRKKGGLNVNFGFPPKNEEAEQHRITLINVTERIQDGQALIKLRRLPNVTEMSDNSHVILAISRLLQLATAHLWGVFQASNEVDFIEIAQCARLALGGAESTQGVTDLALKLDYQIKHLLIDEFQDTSPTQKHLIEQLIQGWESDEESSDGRTLFCVGDPMQSIYRFRKADVSLFLQANTQGIGQLALTPLRLSRNNRSHPAVINWINQAFSHVFPVQDNMADGAISYRAFTATKPEIADEGVKIHPLIYQADSENEVENVSAKIIEARYVAELIQQEKQKDQHQKIAVLVRSRGHLRELVSEMRRHYPTLSFQAVEIEELNNRQTVQDARSLTYALLHRADRVHWLSVLRAPWCGLMLQDLYRLCANNHHATIWQLMQDSTRLSTLSADGQLRLNHVKTVLTEALQHQAKMPLRRWIESTWLKLGGAACLVEPGDIRDVQAYFDLVDKLSQVGNLDFSQLETAMQKLYAEPDANADDSLQFLTIHKSKGLEFDVVILPALNRPPRGNDPTLLLWEEFQLAGQTQLIAAPFVTKSKSASPSTYHYLQDLENTRDYNESARVLYVAATRAIKRLHLIGTIKPNQQGEIKPAKQSFLALLWSAVSPDFLSALAQVVQKNTAATASTDIKLADFTPQLARLSQPSIPQLLQQLPHSDTRLKSHSLPNTKNIAFADYELDRPKNNLQMDSGTLAHHYMELFSQTDLTCWNSERLNALKPAMQQWLIQHRHTETLAHAAADLILNALQITLKSADGQWVLQHHEQAASELSIYNTDIYNEAINSSALSNSAFSNVLASADIQNHRIDRTFIYEGTRWIIDYKFTQQDEASDLKQLAASHQAQLNRYAELFKNQALLKNQALPIQQAVLFLNFGKLIRL